MKNKRNIPCFWRVFFLNPQHLFTAAPQHVEWNLKFRGRSRSYFPYYLLSVLPQKYSNTHDALFCTTLGDTPFNDCGIFSTIVGQNTVAFYNFSLILFHMPPKFSQLIFWWVSLSQQTSQRPEGTVTIMTFSNFKFKFLLF